MKITWTEVPQSVLSIAQDLINRYHQDLQEAAIAFVFRSEGQVSSDGKRAVGHAGKVPEQIKPHLDTEFDFIIWLAQDAWAEFNDEQRRAVIDHELYHCTMVDGKPKMRHHDLEEFNEIIERYGLWNPGLVRTNEAFQSAQGLLPGVEVSQPSRGRVQSIEIKHFQQAEALDGPG